MATEIQYPGIDGKPQTVILTDGYRVKTELTDKKQYLVIADLGDGTTNATQYQSGYDGEGPDLWRDAELNQTLLAPGQQTELLGYHIKVLPSSRKET